LHADLLHSALYSPRPSCIERLEKEPNANEEWSYALPPLTLKQIFLENNDYLVPFASEVTHARPLNHCKMEAICYRTFRDILLYTRET